MARRLSPFSRRSFLRLSTVAATTAGLRLFTEPMLAHAARRNREKLAAIGKDTVWIDPNENPLGPSEKAREAVAAITPLGGRYRTDLTDDLAKIFSEQQGLKPGYVQVYAGSTEPLQFGVLAFTSPEKSYVTADPGFEAGQFMSKMSGARVVKVPLTGTYAHDVKAMLAAAPDAGFSISAIPITRPAP